MAFTCPKCHRTSYHAGDELHGWCAGCKEFTGTPQYEKYAPDNRLKTPPAEPKDDE